MGQTTHSKVEEYIRRKLLQHLRYDLAYKCTATSKGTDAVQIEEDEERGMVRATIEVGYKGAAVTLTVHEREQASKVEVTLPQTIRAAEFPRLAKALENARTLQAAAMIREYMMEKIILLNDKDK